MEYRKSTMPIVGYMPVDMKEGMPPRLDALTQAESWTDDASSDAPLACVNLRSEQGEFAALVHFPAPMSPRTLPLDIVPGGLPRSLSRGLCSVRDNVTILLRGIAWFLLLLWPYMALGAMVSMFAQMNVPKRGHEAPDSLQGSHMLLGAITSLVIAFRTNAAYQSFNECQRLLGVLCYHLRELVLEAYAAPATKSASGANSQDNGDGDPPVPQEIRRHVCILFAFIRQYIRESRRGFIPGSDVAHVPFSDATFYLDPVRPRFWDLLSKHCVAKYTKVPLESRPFAVVGELKALMHELSSRLEQPVPFIVNFQPHLKGAHDAVQNMYRISRSPVPYPYVCIIHMTTFIFVYTTPFLFMDATGMYLCIQLLIFGYYGILHISMSLEDPFGYDGFDLRLEQYGEALHAQTLAIAKAVGGDTKSFIPEYLPSSRSATTDDVVCAGK